MPAPTSMEIQKPKRKPNRLKQYNYSQPGYYFVTICVHNRVCCFGEIIKGKMVLNEYGKIIEACWLDLPQHYSNCQLDAFQIMPNHFHGIVILSHG